jgi:hypothetical protein
LKDSTAHLNRQKGSINFKVRQLKFLISEAKSKRMKKKEKSLRNLRDIIKHTKYISSCCVAQVVECLPSKHKTKFKPQYCPPKKAKQQQNPNMYHKSPWRKREKRIGKIIEDIMAESTAMLIKALTYASEMLNKL